VASHFLALRALSISVIALTGFDNPHEMGSFPGDKSLFALCVFLNVISASNLTAAKWVRFPYF
jgi:hypothetical protein